MQPHDGGWRDHADLVASLQAHCNLVHLAFNATHGVGG